jgi:hypothetical protein
MLFYRDKRRTGLPIMPIYRIYHLADGSHIATPPDVIDCADEQEAIGKAAQAANGKAVELWEGARFIVRFPSDEGWSASITCVSSQAISRNQPSSRSRIQLIGTVTDQPPQNPEANRGAAVIDHLHSPAQCMLSKNHHVDAFVSCHF